MVKRNPPLADPQGEEEPKTERRETFGAGFFGGAHRSRVFVDVGGLYTQPFPKYEGLVHPIPLYMCS